MKFLDVFFTWYTSFNITFLQSEVSTKTASISNKANALKEPDPKKRVEKLEEDVSRLNRGRDFGNQQDSVRWEIAFDKEPRL